MPQSRRRVRKGGTGFSSLCCLFWFLLCRPFFHTALLLLSLFSFQRKGQNTKPDGADEEEDEQREADAQGDGE